MDELKFIEKSLECSLEYWRKAKKENPENAYYLGAVDSLEALKEKINCVLKEK